MSATIYQSLALFMFVKLAVHRSLMYSFGFRSATLIFSVFWLQIGNLPA